MSLFSELMTDKDEINVNKDRSEKDKEDKPEKHSKRGKCSLTASSREKRPAEEPKAREQSNAGVDQGEKALLEIVMAGFETLSKSIVSLRQQDEPTSEKYQLDNLPDNELADLEEVDADSSEYSRLAENYARADLVGPEIHVDLAKLVENLLSEKQDDASLKQRAEQYLRPANCVFLEAPQVNKEIYGHLSAGHRWGPAGRTGRPPEASNSNY